MPPDLARDTALLVIEDDPEVRRSIRLVLRRLTLAIRECPDGRSGIRDALTGAPTVVLLDLGLPDVNGFEVLATVHAARPEIPIIVVSGGDSVDAAVDAMRQGAVDFIAKPFVPERLLTTVRNVLRLSNLDRRVAELEQQLSTQSSGSRMAPCERSLVRALRDLASQPCPVLLQGRPGVGKSLVARALHDWGPRAAQRYSEIHCVGLNAETLDDALAPVHAPLWGGGPGSVFLEQVDALDDACQSRLLGILDREANEPRDARRPRLIAASKDDLGSCVARGRFRTDLFRFLSAHTLAVQPLREARDDIPMLAQALLCNASLSASGQRPELDASACEALRAHDWPGNLRELEMVLNRAVATSAGPNLSADAIEAALETHGAREKGDDPRPFGNDGRLLPLREVERRHLEAALISCSGNLSETARTLGIGRTTLYRKIAKYGLHALSGS